MQTDPANNLVDNVELGGSSSVCRRATIFSTIYHQMQSENQFSDSYNELEIYLMEKVEREMKNELGLKYDILAWWKVNCTKFPVLSELAKDILTIPVSTVSSESAFSTGSRILDPYMSSLSPYMVEALICTQNWIQTTFSSEVRKSTEHVLQEYQYMDSLAEGKTCFLCIYFIL